MPDTIAVIVTGDHHVNSTVALCTPKVYLDDGNVVYATEGQLFLWRSWLSFWKDVYTITKDIPSIAILNGDLVECDIPNRSGQLFTRNISRIFDLAHNVFAPIMDVTEKQVVIRGTEVHTDQNGAMEEALAGDFPNIIPFSDTTKSWWQWCKSVSGVRFDIAHHTMGISGLPWTSRQMANKLASMTIQEYQEMGVKLPNIVIRGHAHKKADTGIGYSHVGLRAFIGMAWQLKTSYISRLGRYNSLSDIGGYIFICSNGTYQFMYRQYIAEGKWEWTNLEMKEK